MLKVNATTVAVHKGQKDLHKILKSKVNLALNSPQHVSRLSPNILLTSSDLEQPLTTQRQFMHFQDMMKHKTSEQNDKAKLRNDL